MHTYEWFADDEHELEYERLLAQIDPKMEDSNRRALLYILAGTGLGRRLEKYILFPWCQVDAQGMLDEPLSSGEYRAVRTALHVLNANLPAELGEPAWTVNDLRLDHRNLSVCLQSIKHLMSNT